MDDRWQDVVPGTDLRGLRRVECDLRGARLVGSEVDDVRIDAFARDLGAAPWPRCPSSSCPGDTGPGTYAELGLDRVTAVFAAARDEDLDRPRVLVPVRPPRPRRPY